MSNVQSNQESPKTPLTDDGGFYPRPTLEEQLRDEIANKQREIERFRQVADLLASDPEFAAKYEVLQTKLREL